LCFSQKLDLNRHLFNAIIQAFPQWIHLRSAEFNKLISQRCAYLTDCDTLNPSQRHHGATWRLSQATPLRRRGRGALPRPWRRPGRGRHGLGPANEIAPSRFTSPMPHATACLGTALRKALVPRTTQSFTAMDDGPSRPIATHNPTLHTECTLLTACHENGMFALVMAPARRCSSWWQPWGLPGAGPSARHANCRRSYPPPPPTSRPLAAGASRGAQYRRHRLARTPVGRWRGADAG